MGSVNRVILVGNLGKDAELRYTPGGSAVSTFSMATTEVFKDKEGQRKEQTEWHTVVVWGKQAENCSQYLSKGRQVYVEGRLRTRSWDDKEGKKQYKTEIVAQTVQFLSGGGGERRAGGGGPRPSAPDRGGSSSDEAPEDIGTPPPDDDIPF